MKKFVFLILFVIFSAGIAQSQTGNSGSISWALVNGVLVVDGTGDIPDYFVDTPYLVDLKTIFTSVEIREGITSIGVAAFAFCSSLTSITMPSSLKSIGDVAFTCTALTSVIIPDGVTSIGKQVFYSCLNLASVTVAASVKIIGDEAFGSCLRLMEFIDFSLVPQILSNAFKDIILSDDSAWGASTLRVPAVSLNLYSMADEWKEFGIIEPIEDTGHGGEIDELMWYFYDGKLTISGMGEIQDYFINNYAPWYELKDRITSIDIDEGVTRIGNYAFLQCDFVTSITIPSTVRTIGEYALSNCKALLSIDLPDSVEIIENGAFAFCNNLASINIPSSVISIGDYVFSDCQSMTSITADATSPAFSSFDGILFNEDKTTLVAYPCGIGGNYTIPESVKIIGNTAFYYCNKLTSIIIPKGVTTIGTTAFGSCTGLISMTVPATVTSIGYFAFQSCTNLSSVTISASVVSINNWAFIQCNNLSKIINISSEPQIITQDVFQNVDYTTCKLIVPAGVENAYRKAEGWSNFEQILSLNDEITLELDKKEIYMLTGTTAEIIATVTDSEIVEWNSHNPAVATVNNAGTVTSISRGTTVITASSCSIEALCTVTIIQPGQSTIEGTINNTGTENVRVNLYIKVNDPSQTKRGIVGGYVLLATTVPNGNGEYRFEDLPEGSYQIEVVMDDYDPEATDEITLSDEETFSDINFTLDPEKGIIIVDTGIPTGMDDNFVPDLKVYPIPFTDVLHITCAAAVETWHAASLQVINTAGATVHIQTITHPDETIHLGHLPAGMYIIRLENGNMIKAVKTIKVK